LQNRYFNSKSARVEYWRPYAIDVICHHSNYDFCSTCRGRNLHTRASSLPYGDPYGNIFDEYIDGNDDGYNEVERDSSSSTDEPIPTGLDALFGGLSSIKKSLGINDILGIKLKSGGSIKKVIFFLIKLVLKTFPLVSGHFKEPV
jgi:hypothetical protein